MNRATAEVQKTLAEEEGFAPVLAWVKALIDDALAAEFNAADLDRANAAAKCSFIEDVSTQQALLAQLKCETHLKLKHNIM